MFHGFTCIYGAPLWWLPLPFHVGESGIFGRYGCLQNLSSDAAPGKEIVKNDKSMK